MVEKLAETASESAVTISKKPVNKLIEAVKFILILFILLWGVNTLLIQDFRLVDGSMLTTILPGDILLVNKIPNIYSRINPNEVVLIKHPLKINTNVIRRAIAIEGETVEIINKVVYIDSKPLENVEGVVFKDKEVRSGAVSNRDNYGPFQVPSGMLFVLADNRDEYQDSRNWGFIPKSSVIGKPMFVLFSWKSAPNAPEIKSPYITSLIKSAFYNLTHLSQRLNFSRIGVKVN